MADPRRLNKLYYKAIFYIAVFSFFTSCFQVSGMEKINIYCLPGQGADYRIFNNLVIDSARYNLVFIDYGTPGPEVTLQDFALELSARIDTNKDFILIGVSLGGMICAELSEILAPKKTIIISSAKNRNELPWRYRFQKAVPLYKIFPPKVLLAGAKILQPIVEPDRKKYKAIFKSMLADKDKTYMKRTIGLIINWDRTNNTKKIIHIHGDNDHTIPLRNIENPDYVIQNGSHMMTLTQTKDINTVLDEVLK